MKKIKTFVKVPGSENIIAVGIDNDLESFQRLVGGYIETVPFEGDLVMIINEEGKLRELPPNFIWRGDCIVGTAVFVRVDGDEFTSANESDRQTIEDEIENGGR